MDSAHAKTIQSPWLSELQRKRELCVLTQNDAADLAIIGGGISGIMTAYFTLKETSQSVILLEAGHVAHGATGHNAGQIVSGFEKGFASLVDRYGITMASDAQSDILHAWELLESLHKEAKLETPVNIFTGYSGYSNLEDLLKHLENRYWLKEGGFDIQKVLVASNYEHLDVIPERFKDLYALTPHGTILEALNTKNEDFIAVSIAKSGTTNSARLSEELATHLVKEYSGRFKLFEQSPLKTATLEKDHALLTTDRGPIIKAKRVVLCTNGFEKLEINNKVGTDIDEQFHRMVDGVVGYMSGFFEPAGEPPMAVSYHGSQTLILKSESEIPPYFYMTRRPWTESESLIALGGPEYLMPSRHHYNRHQHLFPAEAKNAMDTFLRKNYYLAPSSIDYAFFWHGVMGYTPSGLRCVGPDPVNPILMYNLGCNGVGILSSIAGAYRISKQLQSKKLKPSLFDPVYSSKA